jgi:serine/threonine-protein kinase
MNSPSPDEQFFADAAVQLRFVTSAQLAAVSNDSGGKAGESLSQRLVRLRLITTEEAEAIAKVALYQRARDTRQLVSETRQLADPALTVATSSPHRPPAAADDRFATCASLPAATSSEGARFTILRPLAQGGLGQVLVARDEQLNREIALKEILPAQADNSVSRQRFLREAEITGALEHPGIVPVYSLGEYPDGRPFYAMRLIRGQDLRSAIERLHESTRKWNRGDFALRQLLMRFIDVCQAVDYAHVRGIIHRDLKPENIMLGSYGETLVVDWGLARGVEDPAVQSTVVPRVRLSSRSSSSHTQAGHIVGTPHYMSPEQAGGRLDQLGPASDIYSLGATLYHLLTGKPPFAGESTDILSNVQWGTFAAPRVVNPRIARPLEAICLRAMSADPAGRYASAQELGMEIERFLGDEKVEAFHEPLWMRAWRWARNHRSVVLSGAAATAVALTLLSVGVVLLGAANQRERAAREAATRSYTESVAQRERAEQSFALAQQAVQDYYIQVSEETLLNQPGMQPLRNSLLQQALDYYQQFLAQRSDDPALRADVAQATFFAGRITETIATPEAALPYYQQALDLYRHLEGAPGGISPADRQARMARVYNALGGANYKLRRLTQARDHYQHALEFREQLAESDPENLEAARELANTLMNLGTLDLREGNPGDAVRRMKHAQTLRLAHSGQQQNHATDAKLQRDIATGYFNLAAAQLAQVQLSGTPATPDEWEQAEQNLLRAAEAFATIGAAQPLDADPQQRLAIARRLLGDLAGQRGRHQDAEKFYTLASQSLQTLVDRNPSVPEYAVDLAGVRMNRGAVRVQISSPAEALADLQSAVELLGKLAVQQDGPPRYRRDLAAARRAAGQVLASLDRREEAREELAASRQLLQGLVRQFPNDPEYVAQLQQTLTALEALTPAED